MHSDVHADAHGEAQHIRVSTLIPIPNSYSRHPPHSVIASLRLEEKSAPRLNALVDRRRASALATYDAPRLFAFAVPPSRPVAGVPGYIRVILNCVAFSVCYSQKSLSAILYVTSFVCDALDGWFARRLNQVSTFGAVLDMVTDRVSTACLLSVLSQLYRPGLIFLALLGLDIASHWLQMYSVLPRLDRGPSLHVGDSCSFLSGKTSHKDVKDSSSWLFKLYYRNRMFMAFCCVGSEVLYIILYLLADEKSESLITVYLNAIRTNTLLSFLLPFVSIGWAIKQVVNVIQMKSAADSCVNHDMKRSV
ncbi:hypothetical protein ZIOFF_057107 [Zingiber officinale]|uniref:CDP-diacylglycerol--inositol 3-phosphatidyltransferase n=2 Tax=Zingiber officinale TaxID=94328 RepID=A0A8J5F771_ZINOF|nr:hypothetical protein ZIOFF_057107 [Zingiber officinale]